MYWHVISQTFRAIAWVDVVVMNNALLQLVMCTVAFNLEDQMSTVSRHAKTRCSGDDMKSKSNDSFKSCN